MTVLDKNDWEGVINSIALDGDKENKIIELHKDWEIKKVIYEDNKKPIKTFYLEIGIKEY